MGTSEATEVSICGNDGASELITEKKLGTKPEKPEAC